MKPGNINPLPATMAAGEADPSNGGGGGVKPRHISMAMGMDFPHTRGPIGYANSTFFDWPSGAIGQTIRLPAPKLKNLDFGVTDSYKDGMFLFSFRADKDLHANKGDKRPYTMLPMQLINRCFLACAAYMQRIGGVTLANSTTLQFAQKLLAGIGQTIDDINNCFTDMDLFREAIVPLGFMEHKVNPFNAKARLNEVGIVFNGPHVHVPDFSLNRAGINDYISFVVYKKPMPINQDGLFSITGDIASFSCKGASPSVMFGVGAANPVNTLFMEPFVSFGRPTEIFYNPDANMLVDEVVVANLKYASMPVLLGARVIFEIGTVTRISHFATNSLSTNAANLVNFYNLDSYGYRQIDLFVNMRSN